MSTLAMIRVEDDRQARRKQNAERAGAREEPERIAFGEARRDKHGHQQSAERKDRNARPAGETR
jgi:hypothetical protein